MSILFILPLLILVTGLTFISASYASTFFIFPVIIVFLFFVAKLMQDYGGKKSSEATLEEQVYNMRRGLAAFSIAVLVPVFIKHLLEISKNSLYTMVIGLFIGFSIMIWGIFIKNNKVLMYANIVGGSLAVFYMYMQIWNLGELPRIFATVIGLIIAIVISITRFKEKLI